MIKLRPFFKNLFQSKRGVPISSHQSHALNDYKEFDFLAAKSAKGIPVYHLEFEVAVKNWDLAWRWLRKNIPNLCVTNTRQGFGEERDCFVSYKKNSDVLKFSIYSTGPQFPAVFEAYVKETIDIFEGISQSVTWMYGPSFSQMERYSMRLKTPVPIQRAYPWLKCSVPEYTLEFVASTESVLILQGFPGTGKTTFLKEMITASKSSAIITYDTNLLYSDGFFAEFMMSDDHNLLIVEDADAEMASRDSGNASMDRFLNVSDGLISRPNKKIILTTNLRSLSSIDSALLREGRCFEVLDFRRLSYEEACEVFQEVHKEDPGPSFENRAYTLSEVVNFKGSSRRRGRSLQKVGYN